MVMGDMEMKVDLLVIGAGPGGYAAAFRAADLGLDVALVDSRRRPGGVCLFEGCIPSKTYLYLAELVEDAKRAAKMGLHFSTPEVNLGEMRNWKKRVVSTMADGLVSLTEKRSIQYISGTASFTGPQAVRLERSEVSRIGFKKAVIATGSQPVPFPGTMFSDKGRIWSSQEALALQEIPKKLLVVGGGYVGLELGFVYAALGSSVHLIEHEQSLLPQVDQDLVAPLQTRLSKMFTRIDLQTRVLKLEEKEDHVTVAFESSREKKIQGKEAQKFDQVLLALGRKPELDRLDLENTAVELDDQGFIKVDDKQETTAENIFAVGDVCGRRMLAHTAMRQGRVAAEVAAGLASGYDVRAVPAVVYTDPQIAWCGLTESEAKAANRAVEILKYPWKYTGRAQSMGAGEGLTKILADPDSGRILGMGFCGRNSEAMISEGVLAIEMGAIAEDLALSLHPHPTLSETIGEAGEIFLGSPTHLLPRKK